MLNTMTRSLSFIDEKCKTDEKPSKEENNLKIGVHLAIKRENSFEKISSNKKLCTSELDIGKTPYNSEDEDLLNFIKNQ